MLTKEMDMVLFHLEQDLLDAEEEKDWNKVLDVVKKLQDLQKG